MQAETTKKSILLVHGAWHSARCWESFTPVLEAQGFAVHTMTLPGHGEKARFGWFVGMRDYVRAVGATADAIVQKSGSPCVLLGHSMGGLVISAAAEARPSLFSALVYLAAFVPTRAPASLLDLVGSISEAVRPEGELGMSPQQHFWRGILTMDEEAAAQFFYHKCKGDLHELARRNLGPQPMRPWRAKVKWTEARLGRIPKYYVACAQDRAIPIEAQRIMQEHVPFAGAASLKTDHSPFESCPQDLAKELAAMLLPKAAA